MRESDLTYFPSIFSIHSDVKLLDGRTESLSIDQLDGLLLTGGGDISGGFLKQPLPDASILDSVNQARDEWEFPMLEKALLKKIPILAICRGLQVLNVTLGGTLYLDIPGHNLPEQKSQNCQSLCYATRRTLCFEKVNSSHHQALNQLGEGLRVEAWNQEDQIIEQARLEGYPFALGTQYHPERDPLYLPIFEMFIKEVRRSAVKNCLIKIPLHP
jgi:putative glutamine amidotransferase